jgi:hypothetical protein
MSGSYHYLKREITEYLKKTYPQGSTVLDIGAGAGFYYDLLHDRFTLDAIEIFEPTVIG